MDDLILLLKDEGPSFLLTQVEEVEPFILTGEANDRIIVTLADDGVRGMVDLRGPPGPAGPKGEDAAGAVDPGDLTLIFDNKLI